MTITARPHPSAWELVALTAAHWLHHARRPMPTPMTADEVDLRRAARRGAVVWDIRPPLTNGLRLPRGLSLGTIDWVVDEPSTGRLTSPATIARVLGRIGIAPGREVVVYADRAIDGFVALRALRGIGVEAASVFVEPRQASMRGRAAPRRHDAEPSRLLASFWAAQARNHPMRTLRNGVARTD
jgi:hypothetical protein